jgi:hypothetical protein
MSAHVVDIEALSLTEHVWRMLQQLLFRDRYWLRRIRQSEGWHEVVELIDVVENGETW